MIYNITGTFHFLGFDVSIPLDIESSSHQEAIKAYKKKFYGFYRLKNITDYLIDTNQIEILNSIPQESEYSAIIYFEITEPATTDLNTPAYIYNHEEKTFEKENPVTVRDDSDSIPGLKEALQDQRDGVYKIKIVNHEPIIIGKPKSTSMDLPDDYDNDANSQLIWGRFGLKTNLRHIDL